MDIYHLRRGESPLILSMPHSGTRLPPGMAARMTPAARALPDTDWHIPRLYGFAETLDCTILRANYSRYVVDLNRPDDDRQLYPGMSGTGLCPEKTFEGDNIYFAGTEPDHEETRRRVRQYWKPYHDCLGAEIARVRERHVFAVLYDCHSIRSRVPMLFEGELPVYNVGTGGGASCAPELEQRLSRLLAGLETSHVINGRFVGGHITRHFGNPAEQVHAVQMEIAQRAYLVEQGDFAFDSGLAEATVAVLNEVIQLLLRFRPGQAALA